MKDIGMRAVIQYTFRDMLKHFLYRRFPFHTFGEFIVNRYPNRNLARHYLTGNYSLMNFRLFVVLRL